MLYTFAIIVPAGRAEATPLEQELNLCHGYIHRLNIRFPPGPQGMVYLAIYHREHQVWPNTPDEAFNGEDETVDSFEHFDLTEPPHNLLVRAWSPGTTYNHTITIRIGILPRAVLLPLAKLDGLLRKFFKILGVK